MSPYSCHHPSSFWTEMMSVLPDLELLFHKLCNVFLVIWNIRESSRRADEFTGSLAFAFEQNKINKITSTSVTDYYTLAVFPSTNHTRVQTYLNSFSGGLWDVVQIAQSMIYCFHNSLDYLNDFQQTHQSLLERNQHASLNVIGSAPHYDNIICWCLPPEMGSSSLSVLPSHPLIHLNRPRLWFWANQATYQQYREQVCISIRSVRA